MKINNINKQNFSGICLPNSRYESVRNLAMSLKFQKVPVIGKQTYYVNNDINTKKKLIDYIRVNNDFSRNECGFVFLPWSKECWIITNPKFEQEIFKKVKKIYNGAYMDLSL